MKNRLLDQIPIALLVHYVQVICPNNQEQISKKMSAAIRQELLTSLLSEAESQTAEIQRQADMRRARMAKFLAKIEADGHMQVPDHAAAWGSLKAEFPEGPPPVNRLYEVFGLPLLMSTSSRFYGLVWEDEEWFSKAFKNGRNPQDIAIINQWTFFAEQLGGPQLFAEWRNPGGKVLVA